MVWVTRIWQILLFASLVLCGATQAARADLKTAIAAYKARNYSAAFKQFSALAKSGDPIAQYNIGVMYLNGRGVRKDVVRAAQWHRRAADNGLAVAQYGLGVMHFKGEGVAKDHAEAAKWFRMAANQDYADAQFNLGVMHFNGQGVRRDMSEVVKWISLAAAHGHTDAMYRMAVMYEDGEPFRGDPDEALRWYRKAAAKGHEAAKSRATALGGANGAETLANRLAPTPAPPTKAIASVDRPPPPPAPVVDAGARPAEAAAPTIRVANAAPDPSPSRPERTVRRSRAWTIQLAAFRSMDEAKQAWARLRKRHGATLDGLAPQYARADLGNKGVYHRLRAGPLPDAKAAKGACANIRKADPAQGCLPVPPRR